MENNKKKIRLYIILIVAILLVSVLGTTYALFVAGVDNNVDTNVSVQLSDSATLTFAQEDNLIIEAGMSNFGTDGSNLTASSTSTATLTSYDDYTAEYYLYFNIEENNFVYTTDEEVAELLLQVTGPNGEIVTSIEGLEYTSSEGISGFDITTKEGLYAINASNIISVTSADDSLSTKIDEWTFKLYFVYLETNQNANSSKTFKSDIIIGIEEKEQIYNFDNNIVDGGLNYKLLINDGVYSNIDDAILAIESKDEIDFSSTI